MRRKSRGQNLLGRVYNKLAFKDKHKPVIIKRRQHELSRKHISENALKVLYRLQKAGFSAYLVGGSVRDVLLGRRPKDFDIATNAHPEQICEIFNNSRLIGRRFRLVHVYFREEIIEVSTFRANLQEIVKDDEAEEGLPVIAADNTYGTIEEDAWRRDFTVNALYYNIDDFSVVDYTGGMNDLKKRVIRMIGDPEQRYHEDPVRMMRAIRLSAKLDFKIHPATEKPLFYLIDLLQHVPAARLFDEVLKLFFEGNAAVTFKALSHYKMLDVLFPQTVASLTERNNTLHSRLIKIALKATDERFHSGKTLNPGFLFAVLLWPAVQILIEQSLETKKIYQVLHEAIDTVLRQQDSLVALPKRFRAMMRSIWVMQFHLIRRRGNRVYRALGHRYYRAAYDFLALRAQAGEPYQEIADWWARFESASLPLREKLVKNLAKERREK